MSMLELSAHGGRSREKRLRGGGGRAHSFFLPPLRPLESFLFFPMAMRGKYAGGPSLAGTQVWAAPGPTTRTAPEDLEQKSNPDPAKSSAAGGAPLRTVRQRYNPPVVQDGTPPPAPLLAPLASCGLAAVATSAASAPRLQHSTRSRPPCSQRLSYCSCRAPAVRGLALTSLTGLPPPRRSTSPSPSCRRSSRSRGTSARCPSSRTSPRQVSVRSE